MRRVFGLLAFVSVCTASVALACSCAPPPPPKAALAASTAVFAGKVVKVEPIGDFQRAVTLEVASSWKGVEGKTVTVHTPKDGAACGYGFEKGKSYLVYANAVKQGDAKVLITNLCMRTKGLAEAKDEIVELDDVKKAE